MKRFPFFSTLFLFAAAFLLISSDLIQAQRRDRQTRTSDSTTTRPVAAEPDATEPDTAIPDAPATRSANTSAPAAQRGATLEFVPSELVTKPKSWAVLVGANDYVKLANLSYCVNDIKAIEASLLQTDFDKNNVFTLTSGTAAERDLPTRNNIVQVIQLVCRSAGPDDFVFIALNGHGVQIGDVQYFCPSDMDDQEHRLEETAISIRLVL